ncbi:MAG: hypothetical protein ACPL1K_02825, partial [Candidatus Kryptoniota bacterium]
MSGLGIILTVIGCFGVLVLPRVKAVAALIASTLYITQGQAIDIFSVNMMAIRFIEVAALVRCIARGEFKTLRFSRSDRMFIIFLLVYLGIEVLRTGTLNMGTLGFAVDGMIVFFFFRSMIRSYDEFIQVFGLIVMLLVPFAGAMIFEAIKGRNLFAMMGGVPEVPMLREGYYRCQGSFRHAITAGTVGATFFPLYLGLFFAMRGGSRWIIGVLACLAIVVSSHSSGPLLTTITGIAGWFCWVFRKKMKVVKAAIIGSIIGLDFV